jgi:hypothetical protein
MATIENAYEAGYLHGEKNGVTSLTQTYASNGTTEGSDIAYELGQAWERGMRDGAARRPRNPFDKEGGKRRKSKKSKKTKKSRKSKKSRR